RHYEVELFRLKGELLIAQESTEQGAPSGEQKTKSLRSKVQNPKSTVANPQSALPNPQLEAEACFRKAIDIARTQQTKSLELRAVLSLARLWRQQGHSQEARSTLSEIYHWFTEGFDTKDLQEANALLQELA